MGWDDGLAYLPETYAEALRLRGRGVPDAEIAARLDVPIESLGTLIDLAEAKLARLRAAGTYEPGGPEALSLEAEHPPGDTHAADRP